MHISLLGLIAFIVLGAALVYNCLVAAKQKRDREFELASRSNRPLTNAEWEAIKTVHDHD